jgi:hypothetical protein
MDKNGELIREYIRKAVSSEQDESYLLFISIIVDHCSPEFLVKNDKTLVEKEIGERFYVYSRMIVLNSDTPMLTKTLVNDFTLAFKFEYKLKNGNGGIAVSDISTLIALWGKIDKPEEIIKKIADKFSTLADSSPVLFRPSLMSLARLISESTEQTDPEEFAYALEGYKKMFNKAVATQAGIDKILNNTELNYFSYSEQYGDYFKIVDEQNVFKCELPYLNTLESLPVKP